MLKNNEINLNFLDKTLNFLYDVCSTLIIIYLNRLLIFISIFWWILHYYNFKPELLFLYYVLKFIFFGFVFLFTLFFTTFYLISLENVSKKDLLFLIILSIPYLYITFYFDMLYVFDAQLQSFLLQPFSSFLLLNYFSYVFLKGCWSNLLLFIFSLIVSFEFIFFSVLEYRWVKFFFLKKLLWKLFLIGLFLIIFLFYVSIEYLNFFLIILMFCISYSLFYTNLFFWFIYSFYLFKTFLYCISNENMGK